MIVFLPLWIGLVGMLSLFLANLQLQLCIVRSFSLKIGFASLVCHPRSFQIVMLSFRASFGKHFVNTWIVVLHLVQLITHKLMDSQKDTIDHLNKY